MNHQSPSTRRHRLVVSATLLAIFACALPAAAGKRDAKVSVESNPQGALVSVHLTADAEPEAAMTVAGETPLEKSFRFPKKQGLWLRLEKAGFEPRVVEINKDSGQVAVDLLPLADAGPDRPPITIVALVTPEITVVRRGFSKETEDDDAGATASVALSQAMASRLREMVRVVPVDPEAHAKQLRPLWRDARSQMELADPIRLPYMSVPPTLESRSSRAAAKELAEILEADAVLFVAGRANLETGGMKAGKIGIMAAGTASSFGAGYSSAMAGGGGFFTYNIYIPSFAEGLGLEAVLFDARTQALRWANKGLWKPALVDHPEVAGTVAADLLSGIEEVVIPPQAPDAPLVDD